VAPLSTRSQGQLGRSQADLERKPSRHDLFFERQLDSKSELRRKCALLQKSLCREAKKDSDAGHWGAMGTEGFKKFLTARFGTVACGWRMHFDKTKTGLGKVSWGEVRQACTNLGFAGNLKKLWSEISVDNFVTLDRLDVEAHQALSEFYAFCQGHYGSVHEAWKQAINPEWRRGVKCSREDFIERLPAIGYPDDPKKLYKHVRTDLSRKDVSLHDLDPHVAQAVCRADARHIDAFPETSGSMMESRMSVSASGFLKRGTGRSMGTSMGRSTDDLGRSVMSEFDGGLDGGLSTMGGLDGGLSTMGRSGKSGQRRSLFDSIQSVDGALARSLRSELDSQDLSPTSLDSLRRLLTQKYGCMAVAWRRCLDPLGQLQLSRDELAKRARGCGYNGDIRQLWKELAKPEHGHCTLHDFDPEASELLWGFRAHLLERYGDLVTAWRRGLDPGKRTRLDAEEFARNCAGIGFEGDAEVLFTYLRSEPGKRYVTIADIDKGAAEAYYRGDNNCRSNKQPHIPEATVVHSPKHWPGRKESQPPPAATSAESKQTRITKWSQDLGRAHRDNLVSKQQAEATKQVGVASLDAFRRLLAQRYGSTVAAWRADFDPEGLNRLSFAMYCAALERVGGYHGSVKQLWLVLDPGHTGSFGLKELDEPAFNLLNAFREALLGKFQTLTEAWFDGIATDGSERLDPEAFQSRCADLGLDWDGKKLARISRLLLPKRSGGRKLLQVEDLKVLLYGVEKSERRRIWTGETIDQAQNSSTLLSASVSQTLNNSRLGTSPGSGSMMGSTRGSTMEYVAFGTRPNELPSHGPEDLRKLLAARFGSVYSGWFRHLDVTEVGRVPMSEFVRRAKSIGCAGNVHRLFREIDVCNRGFVTLQDLDPDVDEMIKAFMKAAIKKHGSLAATYGCMDVGKKGWVGEKDFLRGCSVINYPGDPGQLFRAFRPEQGREVLHLGDWGHPAKSEERLNRSVSPTSRKTTSDEPGAPKAELDAGETTTLPKDVVEIIVEDSWTWGAERPTYLDATCLLYNAEHQQVGVVDNANRQLAGADQTSDDVPAIFLHDHVMDEPYRTGRHGTRIRLDKVPPEVCHLYFMTSLAEQGSMRQLEVCETRLTVWDSQDNRLARFDAYAADGSEARTVLLCELRRRGAGGRWGLQAAGELGDCAAGDVPAMEALISAWRARRDGGTAGVGIGRSAQKGRPGGSVYDSSWSDTASTTYPDGSPTGRPMSRGGLSETGRPASRGGHSSCADSRPVSRGGLAADGRPVSRGGHSSLGGEDAWGRAVSAMEDSRPTSRAGAGVGLGATVPEEATEGADARSL